MALVETPRGFAAGGYQAACDVERPLCERCGGWLTDSVDQEDGQHYELVNCVEHLLARLAVVEAQMMELEKEG
jgi:hypothetical protein